MPAHACPMTVDTRRSVSLVMLNTINTRASAGNGTLTPVSMPKAIVPTFTTPVKDGDKFTIAPVATNVLSGVNEV